VTKSGDSKTASGKLVAISSPYGSTGKSTVAVNMAALLAAEKKKVLLIDADILGASLANSLLLAELPTGLAGAMRIAGQDRFDLEQLNRLSVIISKTNITFLPGTANSLKSPLELASLEQIIETAKQHFDFVILDLPCLGEGYPNQIVSQADEFFVVALADPIGIFRLLGIKQQLLDAENEPKLLINRLRNSVIGQAKKEISETVSRLGQLEVAGFLPDDPAQLDQALRLGIPVSTLSRKSAFRQGLSLIVRTTLLGKAGTLDSRMAKLG
jgi:MinD-like ATPase involved in chromosome partitioning or flagellar assembly